MGFNFTLTWTVSEGADNYSIYVSTKNITIIDGNSTLIKVGLTKLNQNLIASTFGIFYYVVVAYNETGSTLSNSVKIYLLVLESGGNERDLWKAGFGLTDILNPYLIVIIVIIFSIIGIIQYRHTKTYRFRAEYKHFLDREKPLSKDINSNLKIKSAREIMKKIVNNKSLLEALNNEINLENYELDSVNLDFFHKIDSFKWDDEKQKIEFITEMLTLTPEERDDIITYMIEKSNKSGILI